LLRFSWSSAILTSNCLDIVKFTIPCILVYYPLLQYSNQMHTMYLLHIFFYQISPTCFSALYTILRENFVCLLKTVSFLLKDDSLEQIHNVHEVGVLKYCLDMSLNKAMTASLHILSNSLFINHPNIQCNIVLRYWEYCQFNIVSFLIFCSSLPPFGTKISIKRCFFHDFSLKIHQTCYIFS
jgi:hypothetical protein